MKKILMVLILTGCSNEIIVRTDFDKSVEIHRLTRYSWLNKKEIESRNSPLFYNELNDKRIRTAVDAGMAAKGYLIDTEQPEFLIHYHVTIEDKALRVETQPYGYSDSQFWKNNQTDIRRYKEGTLILDFMDAANCELVWRGWAVSVLDDEKLVSEELIRVAVAKILERFPVCAAYEVKNY